MHLKTTTSPSQAQACACGSGNSSSKTTTPLGAETATISVTSQSKFSSESSSSRGTACTSSALSDRARSESESDKTASPTQRMICTAAVAAQQASYTARPLDEARQCAHLERYLLASDNAQRTFVYSSTMGGTNVHCFAPSALLRRDFWTLVTMGMSGKAMKVPRDVAHRNQFEHAEVMCYVPATWRFPHALGGAVDDENWPVEMLRSLARYVNTTGAWLGQDHGVPNLLSDPPGRPFTPHTKLSHMVLLAPVNEHETFSTLQVPGKGCVNFFVVVPLTEQEAQWKREVGADKSIHYVVGSRAHSADAVFIDYIIDPRRLCTVEDLHCRDIFDTVPREDEHDFGEFADLSSGSDDSESSSGRTTGSTDDDGETERCSSPDESSDDAPFTNKRTRLH